MAIFMKPITIETHSGFGSKILITYQDLLLQFSMKELWMKKKIMKEFMYKKKTIPVHDFTIVIMFKLKLRYSGNF